MNPFDKNGQFQASGQDASLSGLAIRNAGFTIFAQGSMFAIQMLGTVVLARMLRPMDFGLVTMVTTFGLLLASFGLAGFTEALLQIDKLSHALASNLFWINLGGALVLSAGFGTAGPLLARFYSNPQIAQVAVGFSIAILFSIVPVVHLSLVKRAMRFGATSINDVAGRVVYVVTAIICAERGWSFWSLIAGSIAQAMVLCVGALILCPWLPGMPRKKVGTAGMLRYGLSVYGRFSLNYFTGNADNLLVGWQFGAVSLGFYKKAFDLFVLPANQILSPILAVVVTTLSRKNKDPEDFKIHFLKGLNVVAFIGMAASGYFTLIGSDLVRIVLGEQWAESGHIFSYFAPGIGIMLVYSTSAWIHLSLGTTGRWLRWTLIELSLTGVLFLVGLVWGPAGIAGAWTLSFSLLLVPAFVYAGVPVELRVSAVLGSIWRFALASMLAGAACAGIMLFVRQVPLFAGGDMIGAVCRVVARAGIFIPLYLGIIVTLFGSMEPLRGFLRLLPNVLPGFSQPRLSESESASSESI